MASLRFSCAIDSSAALPYVLRAGRILEADGQLLYARSSVRRDTVANGVDGADEAVPAEVARVGEFGTGRYLRSRVFVGVADDAQRRGGAADGVVVAAEVVAVFLEYGVLVLQPGGDSMTLQASPYFATKRSVTLSPPPAIIMGTCGDWMLLGWLTAPLTR
jgi:hypothetical protein